MWLTKQRNVLNYSPYDSVALGELTVKQFRKDDFPDSLPGVLNTQYKICEGILAAACHFASNFGLSTDALANLGYSGQFKTGVADLIYSPTVPDLVAKTKKTEIFGL